MSNEEFRNDWAAQFGSSSPKIICVGLNYADHTNESGFEPPKAPLLFGKFVNTLCGEGDAIVLPSEVGHVDAEAELAVVIGAVARGIAADQVPGVIFGYTCANDVSARDVQFGDGQWFRGKGFDTFCPVWPLDDPVRLDPSELRVIQRLNGNVMQDGNTRDLIFDVPFLVAFASNVFTLEPGDLILTGTPAGVGYAREPKVSLQDGDRVEVEIEGIGVLANPVVAER